jgi:hypothetical protein
MIVSVRGGSKAQKRDLMDATHSYARQLMTDRLSTKLDIEIILMKDLLFVEGVQGDCTWEDSSYRPREFTIRIDRKNWPLIPLKTLAHEMVHVKQFARSELKDAGNDHKWLGKRFSGKTEYDKMPWEIEAAGREATLLIRYLVETKRTDLLDQPFKASDIL